VKHLVLDIETSGLLDAPDLRLHCMVLRDVDDDTVLSCTDAAPGYASIADGLAVLQQAEKVYAHNGVRFDRPALKKLTGYELPWAKLFDTRVISELRFTNLKETDLALVHRGVLPSQLVGKSRLEAWGYRLGLRKGEFKKEEGDERWAKWTPEMQSYCEQDTAVTRALVLHLRKAGVSPQAVETEQELAAYLDAQERNGWPFDLSKAVELQGRLAARREDLEQELRALFGSWFKPRGEFIPKRDNRKLGYVAGCPATKVEEIHFNPGSRQHIAERLTKLYGWKPTSFTPSGQPEVNEDTLEALPQETPGKKQLLEYLLVVKRLGQLAEGDNAWLKKATEKGPHGGVITGLHHIHGAVLQSGTVTHRAAHLWPNLAQVPSCKSDKAGNLLWGAAAGYGTDCRALFTVPVGWVQVGADVSGLEVRELAHYMAKFDGGAYGKTVVEGRNEDKTDIHSVNASILGIKRSEAKNWFYAYCYGAGDLKLGRMAPPTPEEVFEFKGNKKRWERTKDRLQNRGEPDDDLTVACCIKGNLLRTKFQKGLPALGALVDTVKAKAKEKGFLVLHDGRLVPVRHQHAALNTLLQGSGAVVCKRWLVRANRRLVAELGPQGWRGQWAAMGWIHDEAQIAARPAVVDFVKTVLVEEIRKTGEEFNLRVPLDGEAKSGDSWAGTH
jgi:DNA polymerase-1